MQILVVNSDNSARETIDSLLDEWGYTYRSVEDGLKAWELFRSEKFDVIVSDYDTNGMNARELCRNIRGFERSQGAESEKHTFFILCTAKSDSNLVDRALGAGIDDYILSPFEPAEFRSRVESGLRLLNLERCLAATNTNLQQSRAHAVLALESMLPPKRHGPDIRIEWLFQPSDDIGGTLFNVHSLDDAHMAIFALDVAGKGVAASLFALTLGNLMIPRHHIDEMSAPRQEPNFYWNRSPLNVVTTLNDRFLLTHPTNIYSTLFYAVYNVKTRTIRWVRAGYPPPILSGGNKTQMLEEGDPPIGLFPGFTYTEHLTKFERGDRLFFYSEGVTEVMNPQMEVFGGDRLLALVRKIGRYSLDDAVGIISGGLQDHRRSHFFEDDISLMAIEIL